MVAAAVPVTCPPGRYRAISRFLNQIRHQKSRDIPVRWNRSQDPSEGETTGFRPPLITGPKMTGYGRLSRRRSRSPAYWGFQIRGIIRPGLGFLVSMAVFGQSLARMAILKQWASAMTPFRSVPAVTSGLTNDGRHINIRGSAALAVFSI
jgi:hypothetical protein